MQKIMFCKSNTIYKTSSHGQFTGMITLATTRANSCFLLPSYVV